MKVIYCAYREWAIEAMHICTPLALLSIEQNVTLVTSKEELIAKFAEIQPDIVIAVGWSWKIPDYILDSSYVVGMHPSDLPAYAGGSPIQNQIMDGVLETKASLFRLTSQMDAGPVLGKTDLWLGGHMEQIFRSLTHATMELLTGFMVDFPNVVETKQDDSGFVRKRLKPEDSRLNKDVVATLTCQQLYDMIRCHEDPYPNVFLEDETGVLRITRAEFIPKKSQ